MGRQYREGSVVTLTVQAEVDGHPWCLGGRGVDATWQMTSNSRGGMWEEERSDAEEDKK